MQDIKGWHGGKIKAWVDGVEFEYAAQEQAHKLASLSFVHEHVAIMPDTHAGIGSSVGTVIPTKGAIIPAAVGVDIGCLDAETEYLTPQGWRRIDTYREGEKVLIYDPAAKKAWFEKPQAYIRRPSKGFNLIHTKYGVNQALSDDHRVLLYEAGRKRLFENYRVESAADLVRRHHSLVQGAGERINTTPESIVGETSMTYTDAELRVIVMTAADAQVRTASAYLNFRKRRKFDRALELLDAAGVEVVSVKDEDGIYGIRYRPVSDIKGLEQLWGASPEQLRVIADEALHWDGNADDRAFFTRRKEEADFMQWAFLAAGKRSVMRADPHEDGKIDYRVFAHENTKVGIKSVPRTAIKHIPSPDGHEYCFSVSTGFFLIRRGGVTALTGNCGMQAWRTTLTASDLPDSMEGVRLAIETAVPVGGPGVRGSWREQRRQGVPNFIVKAWIDKGLEARFKRLCERYPDLEGTFNVVQLGTLGGGNHFIEVCIDEEQRVWIMLHSGSRGVGNMIGNIFIDKAKEMLVKRGVKVLDQDLAWLQEGEQEFDDYIEAMLWAQDFARVNRDMMMSLVLDAIRPLLPPFKMDKAAVNIHHNFAEKEHHFGADVWVTRKGATRARLDELGIIPGSMGAKSYIVRGKGHADSFCSCSHGAGRRMSRAQAKKTYSAEDVARSTEGVACRKDEGIIDEIPMAYKNIDAVMAAQMDLVDIVHTLRQVVCVKG